MENSGSSLPLMRYLSLSVSLHFTVYKSFQRAYKLQVFLCLCVHKGPPDFLHHCLAQFRLSRPSARTTIHENPRSDPQSFLPAQLIVGATQFTNRSLKLIKGE